MERCPAELWTRIFSLACTDTGYTGRQLSLVSKYAHEVSKSVRYQSISLMGVHQITAFLSLLDRTPFHLRNVQSLFISDHDSQAVYNELDPRKVHSAEEISRMSQVEQRLLFAKREAAQLRLLQERQQQAEIISSVFPSLLSILAPSLRHLVVFFSFPREYVLLPAPLPNLTELTLYGRYAPSSSPFDSKSLCEILPSLQRLHLCPFHDYPADLLTHLPRLISSLTHIRISSPEYWDGSRICDELKQILDMGPQYSQGNKVVQERDANILTNAVQRILVQPGPQPRRRSLWSNAPANYFAMLDAFQQIQQIDDRLVLLNEKLYNPDGISVYDAEAEWLDRNSGGEGCWKLT